MDSDILDLSFLNQIEPEPLLPDKGVVKYLIRPGDPLNPGQKGPQKGFKAYIKYEGRKVDGTSLDKNKNPNEVRKVNLFEDKYIEGIHIAAASMRKNEISWFKIEPKYHFFGGSSNELSFGEDQTGLSKNDPLLYKIELMDFKRTTLDAMDFDGRIEIFEEAREKGKELFSAGKVAESFETYLKAIRLVRSFPNNLRQSLNEEQKDKLKYFSTILLANAAACKIRSKEWVEASRLCDEGLRVSPQDLKLLYRKGQSHFGLWEFLKAKELFAQVLELDPKNEEAKKQIEHCDLGIKGEKNKEKSFYAKIINKMPEEEKKEELERKRREFWVNTENDAEIIENKPEQKGISIDDLEKGIIIDANDPNSIFTNNDPDTNNENNEDQEL